MSKERAVKLVTKTQERLVKAKCAAMRKKEKNHKKKTAAQKAKLFAEKRAKAKAKRTRANEKAKKAVAREKGVKANKLASKHRKEIIGKKAALALKKEKRAKEQAQKAKRNKALALKKEKLAKKKAKEASIKNARLKAKKVALKERLKKQRKKVNEALSKRHRLKVAKERATKKRQIERLALLNPSCRPQSTIRFLQKTKKGRSVAVDVLSSGHVKIINADYRFVSLDGIMFSTKKKKRREEADAFMHESLGSPVRTARSNIVRAFGIRHLSREDEFSEEESRLGSSVRSKAHRRMGLTKVSDYECQRSKKPTNNRLLCAKGCSKARCTSKARAKASAFMTRDKSGRCFGFSTCGHDTKNKSYKSYALGGFNQVWAVDPGQRIYTRIGKIGKWKRVAGSLKQVSVSANRVWGVNKHDAIYTRRGVFGRWKRISGGLKQVAVSGKNVWGVNRHNHIWYRKGVTGAWQRVSGSLKQISVNSAGRVWGVNRHDHIYTRKGKGGKWRRVAGGLKQISVSGSQVWGVNRANQIFTRVGVKGKWRRVSGRLKQVHVSGNYVWGTNKRHHVFARKGFAGRWKRVRGHMKQISSTVIGTIATKKVWCKDGIKGRCHDRSTPCKTWDCNQRSKSGCLKWAKNKGLSAANKKKVFGKGSCTSAGFIPRGGNQWSEKHTKATFKKLMAKHNNPDAWTLCAREGNLCRGRGKYKMKFGAKGKFRYRVSSGNTACSTKVFGDPVKGTPKKCFKYTPNARRRRATGLFANIQRKGIDAQFFRNIGSHSSVGSAMRKSKSPSKRFYVQKINYRSTGGHWPKLDSSYRDRFSAVFKGRLLVKKTGRYHFWTRSNDGSVLKIDKRRVVNNDGNHGMATRHGSVVILRGIPKFEVDFYENSGGAGLIVHWSGPGFGKRLITGRDVGQYKRPKVDGGNWKRCASEGKVCLATGEVRFGARNKWVTKKVKGKIACSSKAFGDPLHGVKKACFVLIGKTTNDWKSCASEGQICHGVPANHKVRYGARGKYSYLTSAGSTPCTTKVFGDPAPGLKKKCAILINRKAFKANQPVRKKQLFARRRASIQDLAHRRPAAQISVGWKGSASKAVDGDTNGSYGHGSCTHTQKQANPWWRVSLKKKSVVKSVKVWNRTDCCGSRMNKMEVRVGNKPYWNGGKPCNKPIQVGKSRLVQCPKGTTGKYVFVVLRQTQFLVICEVKVYGTPGGIVSSKNTKGKNQVKKAPKLKPKPKPVPTAVKFNKQQGWTSLGSAARFHTIGSLCVLSGMASQKRHLRGGAETLVGQAPAMCIPSTKQTFHVANGGAKTAQVTVDPKGRIMAYHVGKSVSRLSLNGIYYKTKKVNDANAVQSSSVKSVRGYTGLSASRVGPFCILSGCVAGKTKNIGTLPKRCWPTQRTTFDVASGRPGVAVTINEAGTVNVVRSVRKLKSRPIKKPLQKANKNNKVARTKKVVKSKKAKKVVKSKKAKKVVKSKKAKKVVKSKKAKKVVKSKKAKKVVIGTIATKKVWCKDGIKGRCHDRSTPCKTWDCNQRSKSGCLKWAKNKGLSAANKKKVFGKGSCTKAPPKGLEAALQLEAGKVKAKPARSKSQRQMGVAAGPGMVCLSGIVFSTANHHAMPSAGSARRRGGGKGAKKP